MHLLLCLASVVQRNVFKVHYFVTYWCFLHFSLLSSIPLCGCTTCPVSTQPFMNFWILSILGLLFLKKLLEAFTLCLFISPGVNMYNQFLILKETARQFSKVVIPYDTPNSQWDSSPWPRVGCQGGVSLAGGSYFITDIVYHCCCMVIIKSRLPLSGSVIVSKFCTDSAPTPLRPCPIQTACTACPWYNTARPQSFSP